MRDIIYCIMMAFHDFTSIRVELVAAAFVILIAFFVKNYMRRWRTIPPGPYGLPVVGYMPFLTNKPHVKLMQLRKKYGDLISVQFGSQQVVVLNNGEMIREAISNPELLGRPDQKLFFVVPIESPFFDNGKVWLEHRRFVNRVFKELDVGREMEEHIKAEIDNFVQVIREQRSKPFDMTYSLSLSVSNYITALIFGKRYEIEESERKILNDILLEASKCISSTTAVVFFPWIKSVALLRKALKLDYLIKLYEDFDAFTKRKLKEYKENRDEIGTKDFINFYLSELSSKLQKNSDTTFSEKLIPDCIQVLYGTGSETVRTTLIWCFYTMAAYQEVQKKVQEEIDEIVGCERDPRFSDQKSMPYTQSVLMEIQRWQTVVPLGVLRIALADTEVAGYQIPKGTFIMPNLYAAHHDPRYWKNPDEFMPERFLTPDGKQIIRNIDYMPFSFGKRNCVGERIAVVETFLYFASILQKFRLSLPEGHKPNFDGILGITYQMTPQKICFIPRDTEVKEVGAT